MFRKKKAEIFTIPCDPYRNEIGTCCLQQGRKPFSLLELYAVFQPIFDSVDIRRNRIVFSTTPLDLPDDITVKPRSIFQTVATIFVTAPVPEAREETVNEMIIGTVYLHAVIPSFLGPLRRPGENINELMNLRNGKLFARDPGI